MDGCLLLWSMPAVSFYQVHNNRKGIWQTSEGCEKVEQTESGDDEDDRLYPCPEENTITEDLGNDSDLEQPEWDIGIRRSEASKGREVEDISLSDIILDPDGSLAYYWLGIVTVAVIYNIAVTVLRLAFEELRHDVMQDSVFFPLDTITDLIYILDIFVSFRISHYEDGCLVLDPARIVEHYRKTIKFKTDVVAILPVGTVYTFVRGIKSIFCTSLPVTGEDVCIALVRMPRLLKYPTMSKFFDITDSRTRNPTMVRATKLTFNLWVVIHWIGCIYYMVSEYEGLGTNEWVYPNGTEFNPLYRKYIRVTYWSLMTLTTIGERPAPVTDLEFVFTGVTFLIGVFVFAAVVGNVGDVISNMNAARQEFQSRMDQIKSYLQHRKVPERIQYKVKRWADYTWTRTQAVDEPTLLQMLPDRLRSEIAINVHLDTLKKVKIFEECEEGLLRELVLKLRSQVFSPGDYICRIGEIGKEMYIVNHGRVEILVPNGQNGHRTVVATLMPGNYFGEISLLKLDDGHNRRTADVRAVGFSELLRLSRKDLMLALVEYPNAKRILETQAIERMHKTKEVRSACGTGIATPAETTHQEEKNLKKNDLLLQVVKSNNFQKLLSSRKSETAELRNILSEVKQFDSQTTKRKLETLQTEKTALEAQVESMKKELEALKQQNKISANHSGNGENLSLLKVNGQLRIRRRRRSSSGLRSCYTCNRLIENGDSRSADETECGADCKSPTSGLCESKSWSGSIKDKDICKHHLLKRRLFQHSNSSPNLLNKGSRCVKGSQEYNSLNVKRPSVINDIPDINVTDMSEAEKTDNEKDSETINVLENILALESDTGLSEMSDNSDKSSDEDNDI